MSTDKRQRPYSLKKIQQWALADKSVRFVVETEAAPVSVLLRFYRNGIVRYVMCSSADRVEKTDLVDPEFLVLEERPSVEEAGDCIILESPTALVKVFRDPWKIEVCDSKGKSAVLKEQPVDLDAHDWTVSYATGYQERDGKPYSTRINLNLDPHERLFGLGEKFTALNKRSQRIRCWNVNPYGAGRETAYKNIPLLLSTRGYGLFLNETCSSTWDVGSTSNFSLSIEVDGTSFDLFIILGHTLKEILGKYADLTGHASLPPRWSFGLWISPFGEQRLSKRGMNQEELLELVDTIRSRGIPCDVIHLDPYWMGGTKLCHFQWDGQLYPDPPAMIQKLKEKGFRVCLWEHPYMEKGGEVYNEAAQKGYLLRRSDGSVYDTEIAYISPEKRQGYTESFYAVGSIVDFSNPEAVEWYKSKHRPLLEMGVATFKSDFGEMIPYDAHFFNGKTGREMHNVYPLLYNRAVFEVIQEYQERPVVWGRSGYAGSQKYPVQWSGDPLADFNSLSATVRGGLCYGLSGVPFWTFDLGGFKGEPTIEAYIRWAQTGLLISHSRFHGTTPRLPWYFGDRAVEIIKKYVHLRYRLLPYLYAVAWEAVRTGVPVMRALGLEFPNDPGSLANETEFLLGSSLLVAPVLNAEGEVDVYLPPGTWYDYWNEQKHQGPAQIHRSCDMEDYPLYIRSTAVLPVSDDSSTVSDLWDPLVFELYPAAEGAFEIPEEEGRQSTYFAVSKKCSVTKIEARGPERKWRVVLHDVVETQEVTISAPVRGDWRYNQKTRTLQITVEKCDHLEIDTYWIG